MPPWVLRIRNPLFIRHRFPVLSRAGIREPLSPVVFVSVCLPHCRAYNEGPRLSECMWGVGRCPRWQVMAAVFCSFAFLLRWWPGQETHLLCSPQNWGPAVLVQNIQRSHWHTHHGHWTLSLFGSCTNQVFNRPKLESMSQDLLCLVVAILVKVVPCRGVLFVVLILWAVFCTFVFAVYWQPLCLWKWRHELFPNRESIVLSN